MLFISLTYSSSSIPTYFCMRFPQLLIFSSFSSGCYIIMHSLSISLNLNCICFRNYSKFVSSDDVNMGAAAAFSVEEDLRKRLSTRPEQCCHPLSFSVKLLKRCSWGIYLPRHPSQSLQSGS